MSTLPRSVTSLAAALLLSVVVAAPALAHAELKSSDPGDEAVLEAPPTVITLTFTEGMDEAKSSFTLDGPGGAMGTARPARQGGTVMKLEGLALGPGEYRIRWTAAGTDGHIERGRLSFTVLEPTQAPSTPAATPAASVVPASTPVTASEAPASEAPASMAPAPAGSPSTGPAGTDDVSPAAGSGMDLLMPIVAGLVLVGALGALLLRRSRGA